MDMEPQRSDDDDGDEERIQARHTVQKDAPGQTSSSLENLPEELFRYVVQLACKLPPLDDRKRAGVTRQGQDDRAASVDVMMDADEEQGDAAQATPASSKQRSNASPLDVTTCISLLLSDHRCHAIVLPLLYRDVTLERPSQLIAFARTLVEDPKRGLLVRSLWVGPLGAPQRMPRLVYLGHELLKAALADPDDPTGESTLASHPLKDLSSRLRGNLVFNVLNPLFKRLVSDLLDLYPQVPVRGFPTAPVDLVGDLAEPTREQWLSAPVIGMSNWIIRAEMAQSALQLLALAMKLVIEACREMLRGVLQRLEVGGSPDELEDNNLGVAMAVAENWGAPGIPSLLKVGPYEYYLDLFVSLVSRADIKASTAAALVLDRLLKRLVPWWTSRPSEAELRAMYGPHRDCREDDFGSHLLYARSGQARLLIPDSGADPLSTGIEEADVDEASDRASEVGSDTESEADEGSQRDARRRGAELEDDEEDEAEDEEHDGDWVFEPPHSARAARMALDRADRFGPRNIPWSRASSLGVAQETQRIARRLGEGGKNVGAAWSLGALLGTLRSTLSLTPMLRCLAVSGFLERAVAGERSGAALKNLRHLSIGPPPANWSAPLVLRSLTSCLRSIDISGCMLFDEEVSDLVGLDGSLPELAEVTWRLWLPHSSGHALTAAQTLRWMLDWEEARRGRGRRRTGETKDEGKRPRKRKVHAVLHEQDVQAVGETLNLEAPSAATSESATASRPYASPSSIRGRLLLSVAPTDLAPNIEATRRRFASKAGFGPRVAFG